MRGLAARNGTTRVDPGSPRVDGCPGLRRWYAAACGRPWHGFAALPFMRAAVDAGSRQSCLPDGTAARRGHDLVLMPSEARLRTTRPLFDLRFFRLLPERHGHAWPHGCGPAFGLVAAVHWSCLACALCGKARRWLQCRGSAPVDWSLLPVSARAQRTTRAGQRLACASSASRPSSKAPRRPAWFPSAGATMKSSRWSCPRASGDSRGLST